MKLWMVIGLSLVVNNVLAEACLLEAKQGEFPNKSCMQNAGAPSNVFNDFCDGAGDEANTMTKLANCPGNSIATCEITLNGGNGKFIQHIYTRSLMKAYELSCKNNMAGTGVWKQK